MEVYRGDEQEHPGSTPLTRDRPTATDDEEDLLDAFFDLLDFRSNEWITIGDVDRFLNHFVVPYREWFPRLILGMQRAYFKAKREADDRKDRLTARMKETLRKE